MARAPELRRIRKELLARYASLRKSLATGLGDLRDERHTPMADEVDVAAETWSDHLTSQFAERESRELARIEEALQRVKEGRFGRCEICGGKIPMPRLRALPFTSTCVECQREQERMGAGHGTGDAGENWQQVFDEESRRRDADNDIALDFSAESLK